MLPLAALIVSPVMIPVTCAGIGLLALLALRFTDGEGSCCTGEACCAGEPGEDPGDQAWITGTVQSSSGEVCRVATAWDWRDRLGTLMVRLGIRRMNYRVAPGLYAVGEPDEEAPVFVTANYKMSFDHLRRDLADRDGWIMVLDTHGINVWCAAGEGTFGTYEILRRIEVTDLGEIVSHRELIVPQLGAPGVAAHEVRSQSGFKVTYGPVRSADLPAFMDAGREATGQMREVRFPLLDRLVLAPVEFIASVKYVAALLLVMLVLGGIGGGGYSLNGVLDALPSAATTCGLGLLSGTVLMPALLPWLPGRAFAAKGAVAGLAAGGVAAAFHRSGGGALAGALSCLLLVGVIASVLGMNFTGSSTYTSLSGVRKEMRVAVPAQVAAGLVGLVLWTLG